MLWFLLIANAISLAVNAAVLIGTREWPPLNVSACALNLAFLLCATPMVLR